jgi:diacylglycerol O-acyltransferase/trehalose O-mycolyltransferase
MRRPRSAALAPVVLLVLLVLAPSAANADRLRLPGHGNGGANVVAETRVAAHIVDLTIQSPALGRTASVRLITPDGWDQRRRGERWPVLYLLHGCCDTPDSWTRETDVEDLQQLRHVLVVTPEGGDVGWYSDWWNYGAGGPPAWETFHLREVRTLLEQRYGAGQRRAIAGLSMGGFGALSYAGRHPGMFRAVASYSGVVTPLYEPGAVLGLTGDFGLDPFALWGDPDAQRAIWEAHDPYYLAKRLRHTPLFMSVGDGTAGPFDPPGAFDDREDFLHGMNLALAARFADLKIPVTTDFYGPGTHDWPYWERELHRSLPMLLGALGDKRSTASAAA